MPETSVHEKYCLVSGKHYVWLAWQVLAVQTEPEAPLMEQASHQQFGLGVLAPNAGHHPAASCRVYNIGHALVYEGVMPIALWKYLSATS